MQRDSDTETLLWQPSEEQIGRSNIKRYLRWLKERRGLDFDTYHDVWRWSVTDLEGFWTSIWEFCEVRAHRPYSQVLNQHCMPGARWFEGAELNYAEHALSRDDEHPAIIAGCETHPLVTMSYRELARQTAAVATSLRRRGVRRGDRIVAFMPNIPETVVAFLATASIGAIWSSCSTEFGTRSVVDRFRQIEPKVLLAVDGYQYGGRQYDRLSEVSRLQDNLPTLETTIIVPYLNERSSLDHVQRVISWQDVVSTPAELAFEQVPFQHPLWVLYSSGTTGLPKAIVHGHGGILLEHLKSLCLHLDINSEDRFFWFTTTGWMMWNFLISGLLLGATVILYDGHPGYPDMMTLWKFAEATGMTYFGTSAPYIQACMKADIEPSKSLDMSRIRGVGSTAAPLSPKGFQWVYDKVGPDLLLNPFSGGTDLCTGFVGACPILPVIKGEIPCRMLGASVEAYDEKGRSVSDEVGELVLTRPMPSMPLFLWNDPDERRYKESYFEMFPGVWRHGDWIQITKRGGCVIHGRSDSTLKRGGVRMGTSEFYAAIEEIPEILDSLVVDTGRRGEEGRLLLFVVLQDKTTLDDRLRARIKEKLRSDISPRHVPDEIHTISEVPYTLNGKKMEVPVKRILTGTSVEEAVSRGALRNPDSLCYFVAMANNTNSPGSAADAGLSSPQSCKGTIRA
jgi:acetoacetyl-CoA synthetase